MCASIHIDSYWYEPLVRDDKLLERMVDGFPDLNAPYSHHLVLFVDKLGLYQKHYGRDTNVAQALWQKNSAFWYKSATWNRESFTFKEILSALYALSDLSERPPASFLCALLNQATNLMERADPGDPEAPSPLEIGNVLTPFYGFAFTPPLSFFRALFALVLRTKEGWAPRSLARNMDQLPLFGVYPPTGFTKMLIDCSTADLPAFSFKELATLFNGFSKLTIPMLKTFVKTAISRAQGLDDKSDGRSISYFMRSLAITSVMRPLEPEEYAFAENLLIRARRTPMSIVGKGICYRACLRLFPGERNIVAQPQTTQCSSPEEILFANLLTCNGVKFVTRNTLIEPIASEVDYVIDRNGERILAEYDGLQHFLFPMSGKRGGLNGSTRLMTALYRQYRPDEPLLRIPYNVGDLIRRKPERFMPQFHELIAAMPAGAYLLAEKSGSLVLREIEIAPPPVRFLASAAQSSALEAGPVTRNYTDRYPPAP